MPPNSNTSSLAPQTGSPYGLSYAELPSRRSPVNITYSAAQARYPAGTPHNQALTMVQQPAHDSLVSTNGYHYHNEHAVQYSDEHSSTSEDQYNSAYTYNIFRSSGQNQESTSVGQDYQQYAQYYLPATTFPSQDQPNYDRVLVFDPIEDDQVGSRVDPRHLGQAHHGEERCREQEAPAPSRSAHQSNQTVNVARTPTAGRWSREYSPEERMRLGLRRWETEQHRIDEMSVISSATTELDI